MRDRLSAAAQTVGDRGALSELRVTTIHGLCNRIQIKARDSMTIVHDIRLAHVLHDLPPGPGPADRGERWSCARPVTKHEPQYMPGCRKSH
jgi:hypothetical protein